MYSGFGGMSSVLFSILKGDQERTIDWVVVFYGIEELLPEYGQKCKELQIPYVFIKKEKAGFDFNGQQKIIGFLVKEKPNSIICHLPSLIFSVQKYCKKHRPTKLIAVEHHALSLKSKKDWFLSGVLPHYADQVVYQSELYRDQVAKKMGLFARKKKGVIIPNGIDTDFYQPLEHIEKNELFTIGMMGRLVEGKDFETVIEAVKLLTEEQNNIQFMIAGDGVRMQELQELVKAKGVEKAVVFLGLLPEQELPNYLNQLDVYVHSTAGETINTSIMQAMSVCLPVLVSDVPEVNSMVIEGENGLLFERGNATQLMEKIMSLMDNSYNLKKMGEVGRQMAITQYSSKRMAQSYLDLV